MIYDTASFRDPAEARTQDPQIKSLLLYQLSYEVEFFAVGSEGFEPSTPTLSR